MPRKKYNTDEERIEANRKRSRLWQENNKEKAYENHARYRINNREKVNLISKESRERNKIERLERRRDRNKERKLDSNYKFSENIRSLTAMSFKRAKINSKKNKRTEEILGCTLDFFRKYILSKCPEGTKLDDFGRYGYHIDHIIPISLASSEEEILKLSHYSNLQPLWWRDNIIKRNKIL